MEITFYRKIANSLADTVISNNPQYSDTEAKKIKHALVCFFSDLYKFLLYLLIFFIMSLTMEFFTAFLAVLLLRPFLGGFHAKNEVVCIFISFTTMLISIIIGGMNLIPSYAEIPLIIVMPIIGVLIAPVHAKKVIENTVPLKILAGTITAGILIIDYYFTANQILSVSVFIIYILAFYQLIKNVKIKHPNTNF